MTTSNVPVPTPTAAPARKPLRLRMAEDLGLNSLDGGWWPQSRDLAVELADLVDHFPAEIGTVVRAVYSPPDWDPTERRVPVARGFVKVGSFPEDDTHLIQLRLWDDTMLHVLVVPSGLTDEQGSEALLASATTGNMHSAADLLETVTDSPAFDPSGLWDDDGGSGPTEYPALRPV